MEILVYAFIIISIIVLCMRYREWNENEERKDRERMYAEWEERERVRMYIDHGEH